MYSFSANSKGEEALLHPQNSYLLVIQKKNEGYYVVVEFKANPDLPKELDRRLRISDAVIRHMIINKDEK